MTPDGGSRVVLEISSAVEALKFVDQVSQQFASMAGLDEEGAHTFGIAVREAAVNAIRHGNANDRHKRVYIEYDVPHENGHSYARVRVRDEGVGFDPSSVPDPLAHHNVSLTTGRGIFLMRSFMDNVAVHRMPHGGTEIVMLRRLPAS